MNYFSTPPSGFSGDENAGGGQDVEGNSRGSHSQREDHHHVSRAHSRKDEVAEQRGTVALRDTAQAVGIAPLAARGARHFYRSDRVTQGRQGSKDARFRCSVDGMRRICSPRFVLGSTRTSTIHL